VNTGVEGEEVLRHDPHVRDFVVIPKGLVAEHDLDAYWSALGSRYDRVINLCGSFEGALLKIPSRPDYFWPDAARRQTCAFNYLELAHLVAGVPHSPRQRFYPTEEETAWARELVSSKPTVVWTLGGSGQHKLWPWIAAAIVQLLERNRACQVLLVGGSDRNEVHRTVCQRLECYSSAAATRFRTLVGSCSIRQSMALAQAADLVVGPETGLLHSVALEPNAKIVILSHSTTLNLTRDWINTVAIVPDVAAVPCYPCHRLHFGTKFCPQVEGFAACAHSIRVETVLRPLLRLLRRNRSEFVRVTHGASSAPDPLCLAQEPALQCELLPQEV